MKTKVFICIIMILLLCTSVSAIRTKEYYNIFDDGGDTYTINGTTGIADGNKITKGGWGTCSSGDLTYYDNALGGLSAYDGLSIIDTAATGCRNSDLWDVGIDQTFSVKISRHDISKAGYFYFLNGGTTRAALQFAAGGQIQWYDGTAHNLGIPGSADIWYEFAFNQSATGTTLYYKNNTLNQWVFMYDSPTINQRDINKLVIEATAGQYMGIDDLVSWNGTILDEPIDDSTPIISSINLTSEDPADTTEPYTTADTTPTFKFMTNENAWCKISDTNESYIVMTTQCSSGEGDLAHTCTLSSAESLNSGTDYVYVACNDSLNNYHTKLSANEELLMNITSTGETDAQSAITTGITNSKAAGATVYTNQQVYVRALNGSQYLGTFDKVAVLGNQRWLLNFVTAGESYIGAGSLGTTVNVWENDSLIESDITLQVESFINATFS